MGIERYARRGSSERRWQEAFDAIAARCNWYECSPTITELLEHGAVFGKWRCRSVGYKDDGKDLCFHSSRELFRLDTFGPRLTVSKLRWKYVCSACGRDRPFLEIWPDN